MVSLKNLNAISVLILAGAIFMVVNGLLIHLNGKPIIIQTYNANTLEDIWPKAPNPSERLWGRIVLGMPGAVEGGLSIFWTVWAIIVFVISILILLKPIKYRRIAPLILMCSLLTIPIGAGFIVGLFLVIIACFIAFEWPKNYKETFAGSILMALKLDSKVFSMLGKSFDVRKGVLVIFLVSILSSIGSTIYSYNVSRIYPHPRTTILTEAKAGDIQIYVVDVTDFKGGDTILIGIRDRKEYRQISFVGENYFNLTVPLEYNHDKGEPVTSVYSKSFDAIKAYEILLVGKLDINLGILLLNTLGYFTISVLKWLILTILVYGVCSKLLDSQNSFYSTAMATSLVFTPEVLNVFLPVLFCNEPMLSVSQVLVFLPISWPLTVFYLYHIWGFLLLTSLIVGVTEFEKTKALGTALVISCIYLITVHIMMAPLTSTFGIGIVLTKESHMTVMALVAVGIIISWFLGAFKKT